MSTRTSATGKEWSVQPAAANLIHELIDNFAGRNRSLLQLRDRLRSETGTRLIDWIDFVQLPVDTALRERLLGAGFEEKPAGRWRHHGGMFPEIRSINQGSDGAAATGEGTHALCVLKVESVVDFLVAQGVHDQRQIHGVPLGRVRWATVNDEAGSGGEGGVEVRVMERHDLRRLEADESPVHSDLILEFAERFRLRRRDWPTDDEGFRELEHLLEESTTAIGQGRTCDLFFAAERAYWQGRNRAARVQKARQDALGFGWANHDHHTYRSSREHFSRLMALFESIGFECRERFYAGREAGWGAQVLEHPEMGIVIFADVDLSPDEVTTDFAHHPLPAREQLGTIGLWCGLHGEAVLQAGMHHLECQFDFAAAAEQLKAEQVPTMKPFTDLPYLRQAFTQGEIWPVAEGRIRTLRDANRITAEQAERFLSQGALGSHLEILQRNDGYKGFNQKGINEIILGTDPRGTH